MCNKGLHHGLAPHGKIITVASGAICSLKTKYKEVIIMTTREFQIYVSDTIIPKVNSCITIMKETQDETALDISYGRASGIIELTDQMAWDLFKDDMLTVLSDPYLSSAKTLLKYYDFQALTIYRDRVHKMY